MLKLTEQALAPAAQQRLAELQAKVNQGASFTEQSDKAAALWDSKSSAKNGEAAFAIIKNTLTAMAVGPGLCNYCEQSEASDIEHILPKSLFPQQAFQWDNYLLACKQCNTGFKLDRMFAFHPAGSSNSIELTRGQAPVSQDYAFLHHRRVEPLDYLWLDFDDFHLMPHPQGGQHTRAFWQAERSLEILGLNERDSLVKQRAHAFSHFKNRLREYAGVKKARTHSELEQAVAGEPEINPAQPFLDEQQRLLTHIKQAILDSEHPTVWREMIRQRDKLPPAIQSLFLHAPETLTW